ncbi:MAG: hypothetical protein OHK0053_25650 [Microscillaceae bacterium]
MTEKNTILIKKITHQEREAYTRHLLRMGAEDRYLRFGRQVKDAFIEQYIAQTNFETDVIFGIFDAELDIIASIHLIIHHNQEGIKTAEVALSVDKPHRGQGLAQKLAERALLWCESHQIGLLDLQWLTHNPAVSKMVRRFGGKIEGKTLEYDAHIPLEAKRFAFWREWMMGQLESFHFGIYANRKQLKKFRDTQRSLWFGNKEELS